MTDWREFDLTGGPAEYDPADDTDALFDRLGRREPGTADLDDPVAASLALLAGDVDLRPVPLDVTHRALIAAGSWPLPEVWSDASGTPPRAPVQRPGPSSAGPTGWLTEPPAGPPPDAGGPWPAAAPVESRPDAAPIVGPRTPSESRSRPGGERGARGRRAADRRAGDRRRGDRRASERRAAGAAASGAHARSGLTAERRPRVLMMRSSLGLVVAAALVVLGGGMSAVVTGGNTMNPLTGLTSVVQHWGDPAGGHPSQRDLQAKVEAARSLLQAGKPTDAAAIIDDVKDDIAALDDDDRRALDAQITVLEDQLQESSSSASGAGESEETSSGEGAVGSSGSVGSAGHDADDSGLEPRPGETSHSTKATTSRSSGSSGGDDTRDHAVAPASSTQASEHPRHSSVAGHGGPDDHEDGHHPDPTPTTDLVTPLSADATTTGTSAGTSTTSAGGPRPTVDGGSTRPKDKPESPRGNDGKDKGEDKGKGKGNSGSGGADKPLVAPVQPPPPAPADQAGPPTEAGGAPAGSSSAAGAPPGAS